MPVIIKDEILMSVEKPARYTGGELNSIYKECDSFEMRFAFCFPDIYEIGMSHLGMRILYHLLNERRDTYCERVFAPWPDMEAKMRDNGIPLFSLETREPVRNFDIIGFTLQYEMSYTNVLNMLDLAGIPILSKDRGEGGPFVCAGGPCAYNPEPMADFIDFFVIGEGEEVINEILDVYREWKEQGGNRKSFLERVACLEGVYVPELYEVTYNDDGTIKSTLPVEPVYPYTVRKRIVGDLDKTYFPEKMIVSYASIVHDRIMLELFRGCSRGCRFCQAGFVYRPVRERDPDLLFETADKLVKSTGYEEISLASLSTSDYTGLSRLTEKLIEEMKDKKVSLALPSLRIDSFSLELMEKVQSVRKSGLTFAPEAGTQRLRDVINKGVTEEDLLDSVSLAFKGGWSGVKLYFMIGLPTETMEDVEGIVKLVREVPEEYFKIPREQRGKRPEVTVSASSFVPKPFTPFQWEAQDTVEMLRKKQMYLKDAIRDKHLRFNWHDPELSMLEAVFARGDRRTGKVIARAWELGCKFDGWGEHFRYDAWIRAFADCEIDPAFYGSRARDFDEVLPWDHIDIGVSKEFLVNENKKAKKAEITPNCMLMCSGCGVLSFGKGICESTIKKTPGRGETGESAIKPSDVFSPGIPSPGIPSPSIPSPSIPSSDIPSPDMLSPVSKEPHPTALGKCKPILPDVSADCTEKAEKGKGVVVSGRAEGGICPPVVIRVRFIRGEKVKFISHLDLMKVFERALRRSGLPVSYSKGFNPHPGMVFGLPLPVGVSSDGEYADFELAEDMPPGRFMDELNKELPKAIRIVAAGKKPSKLNIMAAITRAEYEIDIFADKDISLKTAADKLAMLMENESILVTKKSKGASKRINIRPLILKAEMSILEQRPFGYADYLAAFKVVAEFKAGSVSNLRPDLFLKALIEEVGFPVGGVRIHRRALYMDMNGEAVDPLQEVFK